MNTKKLVLIVLIFLVASVAWLFLGRTVSERTDQSKKELGQDVEQMFGPRGLTQAAPVVSAGSGSPQTMTPRAPDESEIAVRFEHENRYRGLIWFSVYKVQFDASYTIRATPDSGESGKTRFFMSLPREANIDALAVTVDGKEVQVKGGNIECDLDLTAGNPTVVKVGYTSAGQDRWGYNPQNNGGGLRRFKLIARTDFKGIDYPTDGLSPTVKARSIAAPDGKAGEEAVWDYTQMLPAHNRLIGIVMPSIQSSGDLSARISTFAPVSLFFFLTVMVAIQLIRNLNIHPMNYLLIAAGFFAFHILLAYLVDHLPIHQAFWIASAVSVFLVVSYLRLVLGGKVAILFAGAAQMVYLVFFSYAFFWHGWTGLTVVIGAIVTLFALMQLTGRVNWDEKFPDLARRKEKFQWTDPPPMAVPIMPETANEPRPPAPPGQKL